MARVISTDDFDITNVPVLPDDPVAGTLYRRTSDQVVFGTVRMGDEDLYVPINQLGGALLVGSLTERASDEVLVPFEYGEEREPEVIGQINADWNNSSTTLTLETSPQQEFPDHVQVGNFVRVENEWMQITAVANNRRTATVDRGERGTTAAAHDEGDDVYDDGFGTGKIINESPIDWNWDANDYTAWFDLGKPLTLDDTRGKKFKIRCRFTTGVAATRERWRAYWEFDASPWPLFPSLSNVGNSIRTGDTYFGIVHKYDENDLRHNGASGITMARRVFNSTDQSGGRGIAGNDGMAFQLQRDSTFNVRAFQVEIKLGY